jgi:hypothetical protein
LKNSNQEEKNGVKNLFQKKEKSSQDFDFRASEGLHTPLDRVGGLVGMMLRNDRRLLPTYGKRHGEQAAPVETC